MTTHRDYFACGEVNAKNSFGGYVGFKRFISIGDTTIVFFDDDTRSFEDMWLTSCDGYDKKDIDAVRAMLGK